MQQQFVCFPQQEAERLREARETTAEEISRLRLAEEELVQVYSVTEVSRSLSLSSDEY